MFTGIIEETGKIFQIQQKGSHWQIEIAAKLVLEGTKADDSIAVNGACLTVTSLKERSFTVEAVSETIQRSTIKNWKSGQSVNLERALPASGRLGGHFVQGHIDGIAYLENINDLGTNRELTFRAEAEWLELIVEKGSITLDGISLTVAKRDPQSFTVAIIPHTLQKCTLNKWRVGQAVNIETDILGKYIKQMLDAQKRSLNKETLAKWGYRL
ncbi:MAG TPA: riboflavin synthase [Candidatus Marinimicrobia bacterium]|nr:riboflavin synthase [Candidatus Neomarinimicrobiota bacterium]